MPGWLVPVAALALVGLLAFGWHRVPLVRRALGAVGMLVGIAFLALLVAGAAVPFAWPHLRGQPVIGVVADKAEAIETGRGQGGGARVSHRLRLTTCYRLPEEPPVFSRRSYLAGDGPERLDEGTAVEAWERRCALAPGRGPARIATVGVDGPLYDRVERGSEIALLVAPFAGTFEFVAQGEGVLPPTGPAGVTRATATVTAVRRYDHATYQNASPYYYWTPYDIVSFRFRPAGYAEDVAAYARIDGEAGPPHATGAEVPVAYRTDDPRQASIEGSSRRHLWMNPLGEVVETAGAVAVALGLAGALGLGARRLWRALLRRRDAARGG